MSLLRSYIIAFVFAGMIVLFIGCSGDTTISEKAGIFPGEMSNDVTPILSISDWDSSGDPLAGMGVMGLFSGYINPKELSGELVSMRNSALTDVLEVVDITNFLQISPCTDCVKLQSVALDSDNNIIISIGIKHPFPEGDPSKPITGRNRADLHVFNIEGIVISNEDVTAFPGIEQSAAGFHILNADGYTGYLDESLDSIFPTDATIHPYILYFDDYSAGNFSPSNPMGFESVTNPPPSGNLVMAMGCDYDYKDYILDIDETFRFIFAIGCTFAVSAESRSERFNPEYRIPQHNKKAASEVSIEIISNQLQGGITSSTAEINVSVVDINHGVSVGTALNEMLSDSSVDDIFIEVPGVMLLPLAIDGSNSISGTGHDPLDPLVYEGTITNSAGATAGTYWGLIKVTDTYQPGQNVSPLLDGMDGIKRVEPVNNPLTGLFSIHEFATYQVFTVDVSSDCGPITGTITDPSCPITGVADDAYISFTASASSANGGDPIILYEWDHDYDGVTFDSEFTGEIASVGPFDNPNCPIPTPVTYTVAVRATDSCNPPNVTIFATCEVTVDQCCSDQELLYDFTGCGSSTAWVYTCQGWQAGGCGLPNISNTMGRFKWGCNVGSPCGMTHQYVTSGGGSMMGGSDSCNYIFAHGSNADFNVVSPVINLPPSSNGKIEFDHCNAFASGAIFRLFISQNGCAGPWTQIWQTSTPTGCFNDTSVDISSYSGNNIMFRFQYQSSNYIVYSSFQCGDDGSGYGAVGATFDNILIYGCFNGTLED